jgi:AraC-like DNA-binding protein
LVSTMLMPPEQRRIDAIGTGRCDIVHRECIEQVVGDVRGRQARAVVISVASCSRCRDPVRVERGITGIVRDFPRVVALALLSEATPSAPSSILLLGRSGIRTLVDTRCPDGWSALRDVLIARSTTPDISASAIAQLSADLSAAAADCRQFFLALFAVHESVARVDQLARLFAVLPSTLISRFARHALPSPKTYLSWARLVRAAALLEDPGVSISSAATMLEYSSPQAFSRHLQLCLGLSVSAFRRTHDGATMLARFRCELIVQHLAILNGFSPTGMR